MELSHKEAQGTPKRRGRFDVGRALAPDQVPKYLNPRETPVYIKAETLFGIHAAADTIRRTGEAVVVEGQVSLLTPWVHGLRGIVATGGTAFGEGHLELLRGAGAGRLTLCFDADPAGRRAASAAVKLCLAGQIPAKVSRLPEGLDPDDFCRREVA